MQQEGDFMRERVGGVSWFVYFWSNAYSSCLHWYLLATQQCSLFRQKHHEISAVIQFITGFMDEWVESQSISAIKSGFKKACFAKDLAVCSLRQYLSLSTTLNKGLLD